MKVMFFLLSILSHDFTYIVSGSEDKYVYIWSTYHDLSKFTSVRRDRNDFWEGIKGKKSIILSKTLKKIKNWETNIFLSITVHLVWTNY